MISGCGEPCSASVSALIRVSDRAENPPTRSNSQPDLNPAALSQNSFPDLSIFLRTVSSDFSHSELSILKAGKKRVKNEKEDLATPLDYYKTRLDNAEQELFKNHDMITALPSHVRFLAQSEQELMAENESLILVNAELLNKS